VAAGRSRQQHTLDGLHRHELEVINMIYCYIDFLDESVGFFG
jgi:hypothetical protein